MEGSVSRGHDNLRTGASHGGAVAGLEVPHVRPRGRSSLGVVASWTDGAFGYLTLTISGDRVRVIGLEESLSQKLTGGSIDRAVLTAAIAGSGQSPSDPSEGERVQSAYRKRFGPSSIAGS